MKAQLLIFLFTACVCIKPTTGNAHFKGDKKSCIIVLFDHSGNFLIFTSPTSHLTMYRFIASKVTVIRCQWELFAGNNYHGRPVILGPGTHDFRKKLSSLKPYVPGGVCTANGDPHFYTFDNKVIHFMGICTYTLAKPCKGKDFHVMIKGERRYGSYHVSFTKYLLVDVGKMRFKLDKQRVVFLDGVKRNLPVTKGSVTVHLTGKNVELYTTFGLKVTFDGDMASSVTVPAKYKSQMCGLCGNWNNNQADDMKDSKGVLKTGFSAVGNSWIVPREDTICTKEPERPRKCSRHQLHLIRSVHWCGRLRSSPFTKCHRVVNYQDFERSCQYDLCALGRKKTIFCKSMGAYADECKLKGVSMDWRTGAGCPLPCPPNTRYRFCTSACPNTCRNPKAVKSCTTPCVEGCECKPGYVLSSRKCVPRNHCGCQYGGFYRKRGDSWTTNNCQKKYTCKGGHRVVSRPLGCKLPNTECQIQDGLWGCHCKKGFTNQNGKCKKNVIININPCLQYPGYTMKIVNGVIHCVLRNHAG